MSEKTDLLVEKVKESYLRLRTVANRVNTHSDQLGISVSNLEAALKTLGLGISAWVPFNEWMSRDKLQFSCEEIGYTKTAGKWGFAIRTRSGNEASEDERIETWAYNEAPRVMRVRSIRVFPDLLEELIKEGTKIEASISEQIFIVDALTQAISTPPETAVKAGSTLPPSRQFAVPQGEPIRPIPPPPSTRNELTALGRPLVSAPLGPTVKPLQAIQPLPGPAISRTPLRRTKLHDAFAVTGENS